MPYKNPADQRRNSRAHYEANKAVYRENSAAYRKKQRAEMKLVIRAAKDVPCTDCDRSYPYYVMQFDHLGDKEFTIGVFAQKSFSVKLLVAEIAKCEVVCANCHAERTHRRGQCYDVRLTQSEVQDPMF